MSNRGRGGWRGRGNYRGRGGQRGGFNGGTSEKSGKVKMTFVNSRLHLSFGYNKTLIDHVRTIEGRQWHNDEKCWSVPFEKKSEVERILNSNSIKYEMDSLVIRMANGEYKSPYFGGDDMPKEITLRLDLFEDSMFVIRYIPCKPSKGDLEMLVSDLYRKITNRLGCEVGEYSDVCSSWTFPIDYYFEFIEEFRNRIPPEKFKIEKLPREIETVLRTRKTEEEDVEINLPNEFISKLYPFQKAGIEKGIRHEGRILIADEMGLGKTIQAIGLAGHYRDNWPLLILSPSSVKFNWLVEITKWIPSLVDETRIIAMYTGKDVNLIDKKTQIVITSYEMSSSIIANDKHLNNDKSTRFGMVILDESHFIKSSKAKRSESALKFCKMAERVVLLSGTPALARPIELHNQIMAINPQSYKGACNMDELRLILNQTIWIRRLKQEVLKQLPAKIRKMVYLKIPELKSEKKKQNKNFMDQFADIENLSAVRKGSFATVDQNYVEGDSEAETSLMAAFAKWWKLSGERKIEPVSEYVLEQLKESENEKILIFAHHLDVINGLEDRIKKKKIDLIKITGAVPSAQRTILVDEFQNNPKIRVALLSITAANMGITLTAASSVLFAELHHTPGVFAQAEDRAHRIGRVGTVNIVYLIGRDTADEWIWNMIGKKIDTLESAGLASSKTSDTVVDLDEQKRQKVEEKENLDDWEDDEAFLNCLKSSMVASNDATNISRSSINNSFDSTISPRNRSVEDQITPRSKSAKSLFSSPENVPQNQLKIDFFYDKTPNKSTQAPNPFSNSKDKSNETIMASSKSINKRTLSRNLANTSRFVIDSDEDDSVQIVAESKKRAATEIVQNAQKRTKTARGIFEEMEFGRKK